MSSSKKVDLVSMADSACQTEIPRYRKNGTPFLSNSMLINFSTFAHALSDSIRLQMLFLLTQYPDLCTCEFEELLSISQSKVSYHLKILTDAQLVSRKTQGTWSHFSLIRKDIFNELQPFTKFKKKNQS